MTEDTVDIFGVTSSGNLERIGTARTPPRMKAREIVTDMFGIFEDGDGSDADLAFACCEKLIKYLGAPDITGLVK